MVMCDCDEKTCPGYCCQCFILPFSPESARKKFSKTLRRYGADDPYVKDFVFVLQSFIYLGDDPDKIDDLPALKVNSGRFKGLHYYTCRHFNKETRRCDQYGRRPHLCRKFPSNGRGDLCEFEGCNYDNRSEDTEYKEWLQKRLLRNLRARLIEKDPPCQSTEQSLEIALL